MDSSCMKFHTLPVKHCLPIPPPRNLHIAPIHKSLNISEAIECVLFNWWGRWRQVNARPRLWAPRLPSSFCSSGYLVREIFLFLQHLSPLNLDQKIWHLYMKLAFCILNKHDAFDSSFLFSSLNRDQSRNTHHTISSICVSDSRRPSHKKTK